MSFFNRPAHGFSLIEVLVSLVISGILMGMLSMVMGQVVQNDEALRGLVGKSAEAATLRRILHRDLYGIQGSIKLEPTGFSFISSHNQLLPGPLPMTVTWSFQGGAIRRQEYLAAIQYRAETVFAKNVQDWQLEIYSLTTNTWVNGRSIQTLSPDKAASGFRLTLLFTDTSQFKIAERIPYVTSF